MISHCNCLCAQGNSIHALCLGMIMSEDYLPYSAQMDLKAGPMYTSIEIQLLREDRGSYQPCTL